MAHLTLIQGGAPSGARPVVWNRTGLQPAAAMILRDDPDTRGRSLIVLDTGEPCLIGVRSFSPATPAGRAVLDAWRAWAAGEGVEVRDERTSEPVQLADGGAVQALIPGVRPVDPTREALALEIARRAAKRTSGPLPAGGLFDETSRRQQELF